MPPGSPRRAAILAWTSGLLGGLLLFVWIGTIFCDAACVRSSGRAIALRAGGLTVGRLAPDPDAPPTRTWLFEHDPDEFFWWFTAESTATEWSIRAPLWVPALLCLIIAWFAWRTSELARRRSRTGETPRTIPAFLRTRAIIRRTVKWSLAAATLLSLAAFFISGRWGIAYYTTSGSSLTLFHGQALLSYSDGTNRSIAPARWYTLPPAAPSHPGLRFGHPQRYGIIWGYGFHRNASGWLCSLPLWLICIGLSAITAIPWIQDAIGARRARAGLCRQCRYDRAGIPAEAVCPECGSPP